MYTFIDIPVLKYQRQFDGFFAVAFLLHHWQCVCVCVWGHHFGTRAPTKPGSLLGGGRERDGGLVMHFWESLHSNIWPTADGLHDWGVIFRISAWGIMLSAQPITDQHTHPTLEGLVWLRFGEEGWGFPTCHHRSCKVRRGGMCSHVKRCHGTPKSRSRGVHIWVKRQEMNTIPASTHLSFESLRPPESCEHLWLWCWTDDRHIYGPLSWTYTNS